MPQPQGGEHFATKKPLMSHGFWNEKEKTNHINYLELLAIFYALKSFAKTSNNCNILLRVDNTTAISYINRMGGVKFINLNSIAEEIWRWCELRHIFIFASYVSTHENVEADVQSRIKNIDTEYSLNETVYKKIINTLGQPKIDIFATKQNAKCHDYVSWQKDPDSIIVDAFTFSWRDLEFYAFPPFAIISKVLNKIKIEHAEGIVVVPKWENQPWFPLFKELLISPPIELGPNYNLLHSPFSSPHPLWRNLILVAGRLSGKLT